MNPYKTLNLPRDASDADVKHAYRERAVETHPDKGGSADDFADVNNAHAVLADPRRRAKYDKTGTTDDDDTRGPSQGLFCSLFQKKISQDDCIYRDVIKEIRAELDNLIKVNKQEIQSVKEKQKHYRGVKKRLSRKRKTPPLLENTIDESLRMMDARVCAIEEEQLIAKGAMEFVRAYEFAHDAPPSARNEIQWHGIDLSEVDLSDFNV